MDVELKVRKRVSAILRVTALLCLVSGPGLLLSGCASKAANILNPFASEPDKELGERNSKALLGDENGTGPAEKARAALTAMGTYRAAQMPQPADPVYNPAVIRLMWVPDHVNKAGDLVPAHYYYLRVTGDGWAVRDAFDTENQLNETNSAGGGSATPWIVKEK